MFLPNLPAFDKPNLTLYVTISQIFRLFIIPFYKASARLTVVLTLTPSTTHAPEADHPLSSWLSASEHSPDRSSSHSHHPRSTTLYYISAQEDLCQISELVKFV
ncbi:hypothetical protein BDDG_01021 [Blastomyces dermatitidis ATCC 18188]|uniref:Uncharacterized protein n=1 Tax=Ajellomyces dermatitidis (strain ATCC 18188 / CBS 674.68) TaxID=653446 RepID=F2T3T2_AJEDA|nr:hypothetical protein BDDG_01021 [Blastomyces dermatitidis ATCC 18188]